MNKVDGPVMETKTVHMSDQTQITVRRIICGLVSFFILSGLGLWYYNSGSQIRVASAFTTEDVRAIRSIVSAKRWEVVRQSIATLNFRQAWNFALPVLFSRTESIAGFPGPPGGACVDCRGVFTDTQCAFMVFNDSNGWKYGSINFIDAQTMRQAREIQKQFAAEQH